MSWPIPIHPLVTLQPGQALTLSLSLRFAVEPRVVLKVHVGHSLDSWCHIWCGTPLQANRDLCVSHKQQISKPLQTKKLKFMDLGAGSTSI